MAILVGIDEAGYGPLMGPLVVSATALELSENQVSQNLWDVLRLSVAQRPRGSSGRIVIGDSKKLHKKLGDNGLLSRGVLAFQGVLQEMAFAESTGDLLASLDRQIESLMAEYPWYHDVWQTWPIGHDPADVRMAAKALQLDLTKNKMKVRALWARVVPVGRFNQLVQAVDNKASVLFSLASEHVSRAWQEFAPENVQIVLDRQGGRSHYRAHLQRVFPDLKMRIIRETDQVSSYELIEGSRTMRLHFATKADDRQLPVALASMTSKLVRELFMEMVNRYFTERCPAVKPTAGYYQDGKRFLQDLAQAGVTDDIAPPHLLTRTR